MEKSLHSLKKSSELIRKIFLGLLVISSLFLCGRHLLGFMGCSVPRRKCRFFRLLPAGGVFLPDLLRY